MLSAMRLSPLLLPAALAAALAGCANSAAPKAPSKAVVFFDVTLIDLESDQVTRDQSVVVKDGKITAVGRFDSVETPPGAEVIEGKGRVLLPALADLHVHLSRKEDLPLYLAHGVTLVRNMWGAPIHLEWRKQIEAGTLLGPSILTAGPILDGTRPVHDGSFIVDTVEQAKEAIELHKQAGYDFVKIYSGLSPKAYAAIVEAARAAGLRIVGHVPKDVDLTEKVATELTSIEHLTGIDDRRLPSLFETMKRAGVWSCPTRSVMTAWTLSAAAMNQALSAPEMALVPAADRAVWSFDQDPPSLDRNRRDVAFNERVILELHRSADRLLVGTDVGNPLIVPGASVHDEIAHLVRIGLKPREALRVAITNTARFLGQTSTRGKVAPGYHADLILVDGNPLDDIRVTRKLHGVMVGGKYLNKAALDGLKEKAQAAYETPELFGGREPQKPLPAPKWSGRFKVTWKGAPIGGEEARLSVDDRGEQHITAESYDLHAGQWRTMELAAGEDGRGRELVLSTDGADGRGRVELQRKDGKLTASGTLMSGARHQETTTLADGVDLSAERFLASLLLYRNKLQVLTIGQAFSTEYLAAGLGSKVARRGAKVLVTRLADSRRDVEGKTQLVRRFELRSELGIAELELDVEGWPLRYGTEFFGAPLRFERQ